MAAWSRSCSASAASVHIVLARSFEREETRPWPSWTEVSEIRCVDCEAVVLRFIWTNRAVSSISIYCSAAERQVCRPATFRMGSSAQILAARLFISSSSEGSPGLGGWPQGSELSGRRVNSTTAVALNLLTAIPRQTKTPPATRKDSTPRRRSSRVRALDSAVSAGGRRTGSSWGRR